MRKVKKSIVIIGMMFLCIVVCLTGCTTIDGQTYPPGAKTIGPYVMDVAFDDEGNLLVTKSKIVFFTFFGGPPGINSTKSFTTTIVQVPRK